MRSLSDDAIIADIVSRQTDARQQSPYVSSPILTGHKNLALLLRCFSLLSSSSSLSSFDTLHESSLLKRRSGSFSFPFDIFSFLVSIKLCLCTWVCICACVCLCVYACVCEYVYVYIYVLLDVSVVACGFARGYICMCLCVYTRVCVHVK